MNVDEAGFELLLQSEVLRADLDGLMNHRKACSSTCVVDLQGQQFGMDDLRGVRAREHLDTSTRGRHH